MQRDVRKSGRSKFYQTNGEKESSYVAHLLAPVSSLDPVGDMLKDFDALTRQADVNARTVKAAQAITTAYNGMRDAAADINRNRLDSFDRTRDAITAELSEQVKGLQAALSRTRGELEQERERSAQLKDKAARADKLQGKLDRRERFMDGYTLQNGRTLLEEYNHKHHRSHDKGLSR
mgnify:CR=1 FL=1